MRHNTQTHPLPERPETAVQHLCKLSQSLLDIAERESQALIQRDMLAFAVIQDEKERLSHNYLNASKEFRNRLDDFRSVDGSIIGRLEQLQDQLGHRTNDNNKLIEQMKNQAEQRTKSALLIAQEYGTSNTVTNFPQNARDITQRTGA